MAGAGEATTGTEARARTLAAFTLITALVYWPLWRGDVLFFRDLTRWSLPARWFVRTALAQGRSPLWNPDVGMGFAVLGDPLYGLFYPLNLLYLVGPAAWAVTAVSFLHLLLGGIGMMALARALRIGPAGHLVAGLAWALSGFTTSLWTAGILLQAAAWVPWCALGAVHLLRGDRPGAGAVARAAVPVGLAFLLGEIFVAVMAVGFGIVLGLLARLTDEARAEAASRGRWAGLGRPLAALALALALGGAAGAVNVIAAAAGAGGSERGAGFSRADAEVGSLHPARLLELGAPGMFGDPFEDYPGELVVGDPRLFKRPLTDSVYLGVITLALAALALGRGRRLALGLAAMALLALLLALGRHTPAHAIFRLVFALPFRYMRYPEKYLVLFVPAVALLAGLGAQRLAREAPGPVRRWAGLAFGLAALALLASWLFPAPVVPHTRQGALTALAMLGALVAAVWLGRRRQVPAAATVAVVALLALDLAMAVWPIQRVISASVLTTEPGAARTIRADAAARGERAPPRVFRSQHVDEWLQEHFPRRSAAQVERHNIETLASNTQAIFGIAAIDGYDAAVSARYLKLLKRARREGFRGLRLLATEYALLPLDAGWEKRARDAELVKLDQPLGLAGLYRVPRALPRVYFAGHAEIAGDEAAEARLFAEEVLAGRTVVLAPAAGAQASGEGGAGSCRLERFETARLEASCDSGTAGFAVFAEQHHPGWSAEVDGRPTPVLRANLVMRAVALPPGPHQVVLRFGEPRLAPSLVLSGAAWLAIALLAVASVVAERKGRRSAT
jgi:hypothetical protein